VSPCQSRQTASNQSQIGAHMWMCGVCFMKIETQGANSISSGNVNENRESLNRYTAVPARAYSTYM